jgi:glycerol uptake facilitator protein
MGEFIGTFMMVFFGVGAVAVTSLMGTMTGNFQVGMIWGITIAIAIYVTRHLSGAHFNPAVSLAMVIDGRMPLRDLPAYLIGQFVGAWAAGLALWGLFADSVTKWLADNGLTMMAKSSASSIWCEVFPNNSAAIVSNTVGAFAEGLGVFILVLVIFSLTSTENTGRPNSHLAPLFIGLTITVIIGTVGPLTNAGLNPARDLGPRLVGLMVGFGNVAFSWDAILVYTIGPLVGAVLAAVFYRFILKPLHCRCVVDSDVPCNADTCGNGECDKAANIAIEHTEGQF